MGAGCCDGYGSLARLGLAQFTPEMCSRVTGTVPLNLAPPHKRRPLQRRSLLNSLVATGDIVSILSEVAYDTL